MVIPKWFSEIKTLKHFRELKDALKWQRNKSGFSYPWQKMETQSLGILCIIFSFSSWNLVESLARSPQFSRKLTWPHLSWLANAHHNQFAVFQAHKNMAVFFGYTNTVDRQCMNNGLMLRFKLWRSLIDRNPCRLPVTMCSPTIHISDTCSFRIWDPRYLPFTENRCNAFLSLRVVFSSMLE